MHRFLALASAAAILACTTGEASAFSWSKESTITTNRGTYTHQGQGSCSNGSCSRSGTTVGPNGGTVSSTGTITRVAPGSFDFSDTITGPRGGTVTRSGHFTRGRH